MIEIVKEPKITLTQAEYERLHREYEQCMQYTTAPVSFEVWVRRQKSDEKVA